MKTILVVDDEPDCLRSLSEILTSFGYRVSAERSARSALSIVKASTRVDLVISEERLPEMDGLELLASLKKIAPGVPSIILTGSGSIESYLKALRLGAFEYLNKPVKPKDLREIVKAALNRARDVAVAPASGRDDYSLQSLLPDRERRKRALVQKSASGV